MALYKIERFKDEVQNNPAISDDIKRGFEAVRRLSSNFTIVNEAARQQDQIIYSAIIAELGQDEGTSIVKEFKELFQSLRQQQSIPSQNIDENKLKEVFDEMFKDRSIKLEDLSPELLKLIQQTKIIKYELPESDKGKAPKPTKLRDISIKIIDDLRIGNNVLMIGGAGTGKTFLAKQIANEVWGKTPKVINCSQWTSPTEIIGGFTIDGYQEGKLIEAYRDGHILLLDEMPKLDPNTAGLLNDALSNTRESGKESIIQNAKGDYITKHVNFACIATGNVYPISTDIAYGANNKQDLSLLDRFAGSVYFITKDEKFEKQRIGIPFIYHLADRIRDVIEENHWEAQMSLRWMIGARNVFIREWERFNDKRKDGLKHDEGLTFAEYLNRYISTFTSEQQSVIYEKAMVSQALAQYREELKSKQYTTF